VLRPLDRNRDIASIPEQTFWPDRVVSRLRPAQASMSPDPRRPWHGWTNPESLGQAKLLGIR
jgi:hypothetical protein